MKADWMAVQKELRSVVLMVEQMVENLVVKMVAQKVDKLAAH
jgi:hypothetical protein